MQINIGFGINNQFCQHCACTMASILVNSSKTDEYNFYLVTEGLSDENIAKINALKNIRDCNIKIVSIDLTKYLDTVDDLRISPSSFYRFRLFNLEDIDKILYLDSDVIVKEDIKQLYSTNINSYCIAGAKDILWKSLKESYKLSDDSIYINTGVLLINVAKTRTIDFYNVMLNFKHMFSEKQYGDQDIINFIFQEKILEFDIKYNYCYPFSNEYDEDYYLSLSSSPSIIHYITAEKPWLPGCVSPFKYEYFKYLKYTLYYEDFMLKFYIDENILICNNLRAIDEYIRNRQV